MIPSFEQPNVTGSSRVWQQIPDYSAESGNISSLI
jgi:hypothetical protein